MKMQGDEFTAAKMKYVLLQHAANLLNFLWEITDANNTISVAWFSLPPASSLQFGSVHYLRNERPWVSKMPMWHWKEDETHLSNPLINTSSLPVSSMRRVIPGLFVSLYICQYFAPNLNLFLTSVVRILFFVFLLLAS